SGTVVRLRAAASCSSSVAPGAEPVPDLVGTDVTSAVTRLKRWGDNWLIAFPSLPATRSPDLFGPYRVAVERFADGMLRLDAAVVAPQSCPIFGLDTFSTYSRPVARHRLSNAAAIAA